MNELISFVIHEAAAWIKDQRATLRAAGTIVPESTKREFMGYFSAEILDSVMLTTVPCIEDPLFFRDLRARGIQPPSFAAMLV